MSSNTLTGYYASGYSVAYGVDDLTITGSGTVAGTGLAAAQYARIYNAGAIDGSGAGVGLAQGGAVFNGNPSYTGAKITGAAYGVFATMPAGVFNDGAISSGRTGVYLGQGGVVFNGDPSAPSGAGAIIYGKDVGVDARRHASLVVNHGTILSYGVGVNLAQGGSVANDGTIAGYVTGVSASASLDVYNAGVITSVADASVYLGAGGTLLNAGLVLGGELGPGGPPFGAADAVAAFGVARIINYGALGAIKGDGVYLAAGGTVVNGSVTDKYAQIVGDASGTAFGAGYVYNAGVKAYGAATVTNYGYIAGYGAGLNLYAGGLVTNGRGATSARIEGAGFGVEAEGLTTVENYATIQGSVTGVGLLAGGSVMNAEGASITGQDNGVYATNRGAVVANYGSIGASSATGSHAAGVRLRAGGDVVNGSASLPDATISGYFGVDDYAAGMVTNLGTIAGQGFGVGLFGKGTVINGSASDTSALISGQLGVVMGPGVTVFNYATITGSIESVQMGDRSTRLVAEAGSVFNGPVQGNYATLELGGAVGDIYQLGVKGHFTTITGGVSMITFGFASVVLDAGGYWGMTGTNKVRSHGTLTQLSDIGLGDGAAASLVIARHGTLDIGDDSGIRDAGASAVLRDMGRLVKSAGLGTSAIGVEVSVGKNGQIEAASGTLDFTQAVRGKGALTVDAGATLELDGTAAAGLTVDMASSGATLAIGDGRAFRAAIAGFAVGDTLDILGKNVTSASVNGADQLVLVNGVGATLATLQLSGTYASPTFSLTSDGHGGTDVALLTAARHAPAMHAMVAAMAGLGSGAGSAHTAVAPPRQPAHDVLIAANTLG